MTSGPSRHHVVIAGGGLVGAGLAVALAPSGRDVLLVESHPHRSRRQPSFDERTVALTWSARLIFQAMDLWREIAGHAEPILEIHVSDRGRFGQANLSRTHAGAPALGYVVPTRALGDALWERVNAAGNVRVRCPASVSGFEPADDGCRVRVENGASSEVDCDLLVIADGGRSGLLEAAGFEADARPYGQSAVLSIVATDRPHHGRAYERFTAHGPIALLPHSTLDGMHRYACVWTTGERRVEERLALNDDAFVQALQNAFGDRAGEFHSPSPRKSYPLQRRILDAPAKPGVVVLGNAAHTVHPVAGQGFNLGLRDVAVLTEMLLQHPAPWDAHQVEQYNRARAADTGFVSRFTHTLAGVFSSQRPMTRLARNFGLAGIEYCPPLKRLLLRKTMGLRRRNSRMALGVTPYSGR